MKEQNLQVQSEQPQSTNRFIAMKICFDDKEGNNDNE